MYYILCLLQHYKHNKIIQLKILINYGIASNNI